MNTEANRVLLVDDEQSVLDGLYRQHRKHYALTRACGSDVGLSTFVEDGPFRVVVTDFKMPGMTGTQLIVKLREVDPNLLSIMLTGEADTTVAMAAVNEGHVFRFLTKPCDAETFRAAVDAALEYQRLRSAEQDLLEQTLRGAVEVLADVLALTRPTAFGRATRIRGVVQHLVQALALEDAWQYETAALLSQIGCIAVPDELIDRAAAGEQLADDERSIVDEHPQAAAALLAKIPRLQVVADIVRHQRARTGADAEDAGDSPAQLGGQMLAVAIALDEALSQGVARKDALASIARGGYEERVVKALSTVKAPAPTSVPLLASATELRVGMIIREQVFNSTGLMLLQSGHEITESSLQRLQNYAKLGRLQNQEFRVQSPDC